MASTTNNTNWNYEDRKIQFWNGRPISVQGKAQLQAFINAKEAGIDTLIGVRDSSYGLGHTAIESPEKRFTDLTLWPIQEIRDVGHDSVQGTNVQIPMPWHCHAAFTNSLVRTR